LDLLLRDPSEQLWLLPDEKRMTEKLSAGLLIEPEPM